MKRGISFGIPELIILLGLGLVFISGLLPEGKKVKSEIPLLYQEVGTIGGVGFSYRHISLGEGFLLSKGAEGTPIVYETGPVEIAKGIFTTEEHAIEFGAPNIHEISRASFEAEIVDANSYGPLIIYLNGGEIWKGYGKKGEKIKVDLPVNLLKERNILRITCSSSGWRIWAPNLYILRNIKIRESVTTGEKVVLNFTVPLEDLSNFYSAKFYSLLKPNLPGEIALVLNEEKLIYKGVPNQRIFVVPFSSGIKEENKLEISLLSDGSYEFKEPQIVVLTQRNATAGVFFQLKIPKDYLTSMKTGKLIGEIEIKIKSSGDSPLSVILSGETEREIYRGIPKPGIIVLRFTGEEVSTENTIILKSGSIYEIEYLKVRLVRK